MGERVRVVRHDGELLAAKEPGPRGTGALSAEARVLQTVQGPGVVDLVGMSDETPPSLLTRWVGSRSLADLPVPVAPERAAALCLAVAATVGRLHRGGVVHGAIGPTHVLLDAAGRPVLCGFGSAGPIGAPVRRPATDPVRDPTGAGDPEAPDGTESALRPALDVAGLGHLLGHLLGPEGVGRAGAGWSRAGRAASSQRKALRAVVAHATAPDPAARPSVTAFARAVRRAVPSARLTDDRDAVESSVPASRKAPTRANPTSMPIAASRTTARGSDRDRRRRRDRRGRRTDLPALLAVLAVAGASYLGLRALWAPSAEARLDAVPAAAGPTTTVPPTTRTTSTTAATATAAPATTGAPVIEHGGHRYEVGSPGDVVLVGPWTCDGSDLPAVVHPADGTIHLFDGWADEGSSLGARLVATVPGGAGLARRDERPGCADLVVTDGDRPLTTLTPEELR